MSPDERIKELKKQGYISGVMAGKRIWERMQVIPDLSAYNWHKLYKHLMDNAKKICNGRASRRIWYFTLVLQ